ncbi:MAG: NAD(P)/FAD-dependent oxidoreductase [Trebonia sp.]|uniref:FAD-dependent oxidoreductase n=1 Tax=Trebonia sp. TaxID=2767075 RepID=UPI003C99E3EF
MPEWGAGTERVAIVGAGLAGCLLATLLARRGIDVTVYERREDPRVTAPERGRSINLAISARGLEALAQVGLRELSLSRALPMHGRMVHSRDGQQSFRPYSADGTQAINSISRAELNLALLEVAERTRGVCVRFGHRLSELDMATGELSFETAGGQRAARAGIVLAADGAYSAARRSVTFRQGFTFSQDYLQHGYKELTVPSRDGEFALDPDALHIWPRGSSMMIALPNLDRSFTCTLFWTGAEFAALRSPGQIRDHFRRHYPDVAALIPDLVDDYLHNPIGSLATIRCWPWVHHGAGCTLALVGDAAHAIVPFYGQGANCALEDCIEIDRCLGETDGDWTTALTRYQQRRKANCDAIADMALDNFIEMRDRVNSRAFQAKTAARHALERRLAGHYVSQYELVSFSTVPYAQIPDRIRRQDRAMALAAAGALGLGGAAVALAAAASRVTRRKSP